MSDESPIGPLLATHKKLLNEYQILHLLYHRNLNQHRASRWWKFLNIFHRYIRKLVKLFIDIEGFMVKEKKNRAKIQNSRSKIHQIVNYLLNTVMKRAYIEFNGIIALGQFITLGLALVGILGRLYSILMEINGLEVKTNGTKQNELSEIGKNKQEFDNGDDLGEIIKEIDNDTRENTVSSQTMTPTLDSPALSLDDIFGSSKKKKKKDKKKPENPTKKKKKNDIDDIFG